MLEFLTALLIFVFSLGIINYPQIDPEEVILRIEEHISHVQKPQADPVNSHQGGNAIGVDGPDLPEPAQNSEDPAQQNEAGSDALNQENANHPAETKVRAYNSSSGKVIESVAAVAVENAPPLVACSENPEACDAIDSPDPELPPTLPEPTPTPTPIPIAIITDPPVCPPLSEFPHKPFILAPQLICPEEL